MKSNVIQVLPPSLKRALRKFGDDLTSARKKRRLTVAMMAERLGIARTTYLRLEKGDPTVSLGAYAMALFVLGFGNALFDLVDPKHDEQGLLLEAERLPKRVRTTKKDPSPL